MRARRLLLLTLWLPARPLAAADLRVGYQLGLTQSVGTTATNNQDQFVQPQVGTGTAAMVVAAPPVNRLQGVQLTTNVTGNVSFDLLTRTMDHGLVLGVAASQLFPTAVPDDAVGTLDQRLTTVQGTAQYVARLNRESWALAFGGGYGFASNGRLATNDDGATAGGAVNTLPGDELGAFVVNGLSHNANGDVQLQLLRARWDLNLGARYTFTQNGIFNLAPGTVGQLAQVGQGTNLGAFVRASTHNGNLQGTYRQRVGPRGNVLVQLGTTTTLPLAGEDTTVTQDGMSVTIPGTLPIPDTWVNNAFAEYFHNLNQERQVGVAASSTFSLRVPTDPISQTPSRSETFAPDTLLYALNLRYQDLWPWQLRVRFEAGIAQAHLLQAPLGVLIPFNADFLAVRSDLTPVFQVGVQRVFEPFNVTLTAQRAMGVGALGASAIVTEGAALTVGYLFVVGDQAAQLTLGVNANRTRGVGREGFMPPPAPPAPPCDMTTLPPGAICPANVNAIQVAFNNQGVGATAGLGLPLFRAGDFNADLAVAYAFAFLDPDPDNEQPGRDGALGRPSFVTHTGLLTLRAFFGRGPVQQATRGRETEELDAFTANPRDGAPLVTSRLLRQGAPLLDGTSGSRPGQPPPERLDSRQAYEQSRRQAQVEREARLRSEAVSGNGDVQADAEAEEKRQVEEQEKRAEKRKRGFSGAPEALGLPPEK